MNATERPSNRLDRVLWELEQTLHKRALAALERLRNAVAERRKLGHFEESRIVEEVKRIENHSYHVVERELDTLANRIKSI